jgi:hypothetical protein
MPKGRLLASDTDLLRERRPTRLRALAQLSIVTLAIAAIFTTTSAGAVTVASPHQDIAWLNAQRAAAGIPAGITANNTWSSKCDAHITYIERTQRFEDREDPSSVYYTADGSWAADNSVLSSGTAWSATSSPWQTDPIGFAQLMNPQLLEVGIADRDRYQCVTTWPGYERAAPSTTTVLTYPGNGATIDSTIRADDSFLPGPHSKTNGPVLLVFEWGPVLSDYSTASQIAIASATLTGPDGAVPLRWVDRSTTKVGVAMPIGSGAIIPTRRLRGNARYTAFVQFTDGTQRSWTFNTAPLFNAVAVGGGAAYRHHLRGFFRVFSLAPQVSVSVTYHGKPIAVKTRFFGSGRVAFSTSSQLRAGSRVCAWSGGPKTEYRLARACNTL